jgi:3',5'-cyclic AMP phosphodiesterase CpdA
LTLVLLVSFLLLSGPSATWAQAPAGGEEAAERQGPRAEREQGPFRVFPYLVSPGDSTMRVTWFTETAAPGSLRVAPANCPEASGWRPIERVSRPSVVDALAYTEEARSDSAEHPPLYANRNVKHSIRLSGLVPGCRYRYRVRQSGATYRSGFRTGPGRPPAVKVRREAESGAGSEAGSEAESQAKSQAAGPAPGSPAAGDSVRFVALADSETGPNGRTTRRQWAAGAQADESTGRPDSVDRYLLTEFEGFRANLDIIEKRDPDFVLMPGDLVQGGGYQRAWDEFFLQTAGRFGQLFSSTPVLPALGNWENFGGPMGGYSPPAIARGRAKFRAYFDAPPNGTPDARGAYYRVDYGPVTVLTLDSSNGLPDSTNRDTNVHINAATYPSDDLADVSPGSDQWNWAVRELRSARAEGQVIFVQFHHPPYTAGFHSLPLTFPGSSGQAGVPMQAYLPVFKKYGVAAVFSGHNESFTHSVVAGIHFYDVGVAGDGFGFPLDDRNADYDWWEDFLEERPAVRRHRAAFHNPHRRWVAHHDAPEHWEGARLVDGGKHYGHLEVSVVPVTDQPASGQSASRQSAPGQSVSGQTASSQPVPGSVSGQNTYRIRLTPVYAFPVTDSTGAVAGIERRVYDDRTSFVVTPPSGAAANASSEAKHSEAKQR